MSDFERTVNVGVIIFVCLKILLWFWRYWDYLEGPKP